MLDLCKTDSLRLPGYFLILEKNYPFFAKHKALYPLLLLYRPVKGAITHPKGILAEYKKIKNFKKKEEP